MLIFLAGIASSWAIETWTTDALGGHIAGVNASGSAVLLAVPSAVDETNLRNIVAAHPDWKTAIVVVPYGGDPQKGMADALAQAGLGCGYRLAPSGAVWSVTEYGTCAAATIPAPVAAVAPVAPSPTPTVAPSPIAPPAPMPPAVSPALPSAFAPMPPANAELERLLRIQIEAPDPTAALVLSALVGFGSGQFYAGNKQAGTTHAVIQGGGLALVLIGSILASDGSESGSAISGVGTVALVSSRVVDAWTAPFHASQTRAEMVKAKQ